MLGAFCLDTQIHETRVRQTQNFQKSWENTTLVDTNSRL